MNKKEAVAHLRKSFYAWARRLPDVEYRRVSDAQEVYIGEAEAIGPLYSLELGAEVSFLNDSQTEIDDGE